MKTPRRTPGRELGPAARGLRAPTANLCPGRELDRLDAAKDRFPARAVLGVLPGTLPTAHAPRVPLSYRHQSV